MIAAEQVQAAEKLFAVADDMRAESKLWHDKHIARGLEDTARQLDAAAREALHRLDAVYAEAWTATGQRYLDAHVLHRRFLEALGPLQRRTRRPIITLDCRDGAHGACGICDCRCHAWKTVR